MALRRAHSLISATTSVSSCYSSETIRAFDELFGAPVRRCVASNRIEHLVWMARSRSVQAENREDCGVNAPLFLSAEMTGDVSEPAHVDGAHLLN
jgi:hypothetical protein